MTNLRILLFIQCSILCAAMILPTALAAEPHPEPWAREVLAQTDTQGGLVIHLGCGDGRCTAALYQNNRFLVHGLDLDAAQVRQAKNYIHSKNIYGPVSVQQWGGEYLPYTDNLANLIVAEEMGALGQEEILRVLAPGGAAYIKQNDTWQKTVKPWPEAMDEWSHYLHDASGNAVANDTLVGPPKHLQWTAKPLYCRSHEIDTSVCAAVSANGRIFYILDEGLTGITDERLPSQWALVARDAFNGVELWKQPMPKWGWRAWKKEQMEGKDWTSLRGQRLRLPVALPRRLVAHEDRVYVTLGYDAPVTALDAATGETMREYQGTRGADEILYQDGLLILCLRPNEEEVQKRRTGEKTTQEIVAVQADSGKILWRQKEHKILPMAIAASDKHIAYHDSQNLVCLDRETGEEQWREKTNVGKLQKVGMWGSPTTIVDLGDVVLFAGPKAVQAFSAKNGAVLWTGPAARGPGIANPPDLFVAENLVWSGGPDKKWGTGTWLKNTSQKTFLKQEGRDPRTGEVKKTVQVNNLVSPGHHYRCYRSKATENFLLWPKRGVEFIDLNGENHMRHDWLRASCRLGFMPCNGMIYFPPHQCFCYTGVKLDGYNALRATVQSNHSASAPRLIEGDAYKKIKKEKMADTDWPTYRHDAKRSGSLGSGVSRNLSRAWETDLGGNLSQPIVVGDRLYLTSVDTHTVYAMHAGTGDAIWRYTAGGRVDSPPTFYQGLLLFGSADGWVYALRAADGALAWRFRAAPQDRRIIAFNQLESPWPVHGNILLLDDTAYFAAGRSSYLDGGIHVYGLDPLTGKKKYENCIKGPHPDINKDIGRPFDMDGTKADVLVTDGSYIYMQQAVMDKKLNPIDAPRITKLGDRKMGRHIFSTAGFLNDSWWNRTFWMHTERWPGFYIANQAPKTGQLLVFDDSTTYGVKCFTRRNRHSPMYFPGTDGYLLFADDNGNEPVLFDRANAPNPIAWLPELNPKIGHSLDMNAVDRDKGIGFTRAKPAKWKTWLPVRVRAMVKTGDTLFIAGPPDKLDPSDPLASFEGRLGGALCAVSAQDGQKQKEYTLASPPVFDGLVAADNKLYLATMDGRILCFEGE